MTMSSRITKVRELLKMSQSDFSDRLGISRDTLMKWENGTDSPSFEDLTAFVRVFGINLNWLISGCETMFISIEKQTQALERIISDLIESLDVCKYEK